MKKAKRPYHQKSSLIPTRKEKNVNPITLRAVLFTLVNGKEDLETDRANRHGLMAQSIWESGERIGLMARASLFMLMVMYMMDSGQMTRQTDSVHICMSMALNMKECGGMIFNMVRA
jgi:hypothetical protein